MSSWASSRHARTTGRVALAISARRPARTSATSSGSARESSWPGAGPSCSCMWFLPRMGRTDYRPDYALALRDGGAEGAGSGWAFREGCEAWGGVVLPSGTRLAVGELGWLG